MQNTSNVSLFCLPAHDIAVTAGRTAAQARAFALLLHDFGIGQVTVLSVLTDSGATLVATVLPNGQVTLSDCPALVLPPKRLRIGGTFTSCLVNRLVVDGVEIGKVEYFGDLNRMTPTSPETFKKTTAAAALALKDARDADYLLRQAIIEPKTGLFTYAFMITRLEEAMAAFQRGHRFCIAVLDSDSLGALNKTFNHIVVDQVLRAKADLIRKNLRASDWAGRFGGDECVLYLPDTPLEKALAHVTAIQSLIDQTTFQPTSPSTGEPLSIRAGMSAGVVACSAYDKSALALLERGFAAMKADKQCRRGMAAA